MPVSHDHVTLGYGFEAVTDGFRPVLTVCAKADPNFPMAVKVAHAAHDTMAKVGDTVAPNPVLTDSVVSFGLRLSDGNRAACKTAVSAPAPACDGPAVAQVSACSTGETRSSTSGQCIPLPTPDAVKTPGLATVAPQISPPTPVAQTSLGCASCFVKDGNGDCAAPALPTPPATPGVLPPDAFVGCADGMVKGANGQCRALVCREEIIQPPPPERIVGELYAFIADPSQPLVPPPDASALPPLSVRHGNEARGSECTVCGDPCKNSPCSDLDLVLAITAVCPDNMPVCLNELTVRNGQASEYRRCASIDNAITATANRSGCAAGAFNVKNVEGARCAYTCYGDNCNTFDAGVSLVGTTRTVCE